MNVESAHSDNQRYLWETFSCLPGNPYCAEGGLDGFSVAFIHLANSKTNATDFPLAFGYFASLLRMNGGTATIIRLDTEHTTLPALDSFNMAVFFPMAANLIRLLELCTQAKETFRCTALCLVNSEQHQHEMPLCSPHAEDLAEEIMTECPAIDYLLLGESEFSFVRLCETLLNRGDLSTLPALVFRKNGKIIRSFGSMQPVAFDHLPFPARDYLQQTRTAAGTNTVSPRIQSSRGCVSRCLYCAESSVNIHPEGRKIPWLGRDIVKFVDEIELLSREYGVCFFNIIDSSFEDPGHLGLVRMEAFCNELEARNIAASFKLHLRIPTLGELKNSFLKRLKEVGVDIIVSGIESGLDDELRAYCSKTDAASNARVLARIDAMEIFFTLLGHMMFSPFLCLEDLYVKAEFLRTINRGWDYLNISNNVLVYRGTALHDKIVKSGLMKPFPPLSILVPYMFLDERVGKVANAVGAIKTFYPVMELNNLVYDALNISSRALNPMNAHIAKENDLLQAFNTKLEDILRLLETAYIGCFLDLCDLAADQWSESGARNVMERNLGALFPEQHQRLQGALDSLLDVLEKRGAATDRLVLKTWLSTVNQRNTSGGSL